MAGGWVYGYYYVSGERHYILTPDGRHEEVSGDSVSQFTGKYDRNDVAMYGGDTIEFKQPLPLFVREGRATIKWDEVEACWDCQNEDDWWHPIEWEYGVIIGKGADAE